jgi:hypothetical protein
MIVDASMKKLAIVLALLTIPASANSRDATCFKVDAGTDADATLSGRITNRHQKLPKDPDLRAADGPYLKLDEPIQIDQGGGCYSWNEIVVMMDDENQLSKWQNRHVVISGTLQRFGSALVHPPFFIEVKTIKGQ